jgi:hypothetical protein
MSTQEDRHWGIRAQDCHLQTEKPPALTNQIWPKINTLNGAPGRMKLRAAM